MPFSVDQPIKVLACVGKTGVECLEIGEMSATEFPGHSIIYVNTSESPNKAMEMVDEPLTHYGVPIEITWRVAADWGKKAHPDTVDWMMRNWNPHLYQPVDGHVDEKEELADLDEFDRMLGNLDVGNTSG